MSTWDGVPPGYRDAAKDRNNYSPAVTRIAEAVQANHNLWHTATVVGSCREPICREIYAVALNEGWVEKWPDLF